jgi:hypothetical protein
VFDEGIRTMNQLVIKRALYHMQNIYVHRCLYSYVLAISKEQKTYIIHYRTVPRLS